MTSFAYPEQTASLFEFKSTTTRLTAFVPVTFDCDVLQAALQQQLGGTDHFLAGEQIVIDFNSLPQIPSAVEIVALVNLLRQYALAPIAAQGGNQDQQVAAREAGLVVLFDSEIAPSNSAQHTPPEHQPETLTQQGATIITRPVRTGQQVYAKGGDLIVLALVSNGAEVIADGNIHVYAPLRGRALAGARGDTNARIFTTCMEAELVSVAGVYRSLDEALPDAIRSKPAQISLDQDKLMIEALNNLN
ncbi:septum site-determining protein MinC [Chitinibacter bivalviorum]|uniref:Probable septum site-determining protein MinC n=1 Tax=Chitinibacter bivalviorum TaxID=2739434 RepID=A0A7H9BEW4_9NEIS|nr:septum site-determining protein MinC [Chitinibacter bivalviorum]QLG87243.1 septum site-determining protein MinC [Chitinibacter bivalviorum]